MQELRPLYKFSKSLIKKIPELILMKNKISLFKKIIFEQKLFLIAVISAVVAFYIGNALALDPANDILTGAKADVTSNFGTSSTLMYFIYVVEIFAGISAYIKTKNLFALMGLLVVVVFTYGSFAVIGS